MTFPDKKLMADYKHRMEEAKKRDHRRLGTAQELFFFNPLSPGSCFFLPNGARIYNTLVEVALLTRSCLDGVCVIGVVACMPSIAQCAIWR